MILRRLRKWAGCEDGVAALEFALVAPFLIFLLLGGFDLSRFLLVQQKVEKTVFTLADLTAQSDPKAGVGMSNVFAAVNEIMSPYSLNTGGYAIVTSVTKDAPATAKPKVRWQCTSGNTPKDSKVGAVGQNANLPEDYLIDDKDNLVVAEVYYSFSTVFATAFIPPRTIYRSAMFRPRLGELTNSPC